ncbi:GAP1-N2 domain-containing protein [Paenibacillus sp. CMAA1364]
MENTTPQRIQQQLYTRERRGIFRSTEGFDTIARSKGLDHSFIKKTLHPFCAYDAPAELSSRGEKDANLYPEALHLYRTEQGQTILGRSMYQSVDFTGLRSAFFTHNYVIPSQRSDEVVENYTRWLHADFVDTYDIEQGLDLPELDAVPIRVQEQSSKKDIATLLADLHIDEKIFKQMLFAVMTAVTSKKKVYISLDVPAEQISLYATQLLEVLYGSLPYAFRKELGFLTYSKEPQSKKGIHVMFVERGSLRIGDRNVEKDFTFDLVAKRVTNVDMDLTRPSYFEFAWRNLNDSKRGESFFQFATLMLSDMDHIRQTSIASYNELAIFYQIEEGNEALFEENKSAVLHGLLDYLSLPGAMSSKVRLNDIFLARFDQEFDLMKQGQVPDLAIVEAFKDYYRICGKNNEGKIVTYLMVAISHASSTKRKEVVSAFYQVIESSSALNKAFFDMVLNSGFSKPLFQPYIQEKFTLAPTATDVMQFVGEWGKNHPVVTRDEYFVDLAKSQLLAKLRKASEPVTAVNALLDQQHKVEKMWEQAGQGAITADVTLLDQLAYVANLFLLTELDLEALSIDQLLRIQFLAEPLEVKSWASKFDARIKSQAAVMSAAYAWFKDDQPNPRVLDGLSPMELDRVQQLGCHWLAKQIVPEQFGHISLAFYQGGQASINYSGLINFIRRHVQDKEVIYQFFQWSATQPMYVSERSLNPAYASAIVSYFKNNDREAFKQKDRVQKYFSSPSTKLRPVYAKVKLELSTPFVKFLRRNRKPLTMLSMYVGVILLLLIGGFYGLKAMGVFDKKPEVVQNVPPPIVVEPSPEIPSSPVVVYAQQAEVTNGTVGDTQFVFLFEEAGTCDTFDATTITLELADGSTPKILTGLIADKKCEVVAEPDTVTDSTIGDADADSGAIQDATVGNGDTGEPSKNADDVDKTSEDKSTDVGVETGTSDEGKSATDIGTDSQKPTPTINLDHYKSSVTVTIPDVTMESLNGSKVKVGTETYELSEKPTS